jgi:putative SOS response-associated peptidase YedK
LPLWSPEQITQLAQRLELKPRYNIAPTQSIACIHPTVDSERRDCSRMRWGLLPPWAKELAVGNRMINARSETVQEKRSFKNAFQTRRCLIPADGYYEWMKTSEGKQPYLIQRPDQGLLAMAGLWESNPHLGNGQPIHSVTILTTAANQTTKHIHDRMPVFLNASDWERWLSGDDEASLRGLLRPAANDLLEATPVSKTVNSPRNDSPDCVQPLDDSANQATANQATAEQVSADDQDNEDDRRDQPSLF